MSDPAEIAIPEREMTLDEFLAWSETVPKEAGRFELWDGRVVEKHGGKLESFGHPTTTLEDLFRRIVEESKARPGRRYLPAADGTNGAWLTHGRTLA